MNFFYPLYLLFMCQSLKTRGTPAAAQDGNFSPMQYTLDSYINQEPISPPESYPIPPGSDLLGVDHINFQHSYGNQAVEENKECLVMTRNIVDLLSSILNSITEPKSVEVSNLYFLVINCHFSVRSLAWCKLIYIYSLLDTFKYFSIKNDSASI